MTSRRKQIRPIKASCQNADMCQTKTEFISPKIDSGFSNLELQRFSQSLPPEILNDPEKLMIMPTIQEKTFEGFEVDLTKKEESLDKFKMLSAMEDNLDDISKKMNKDEAKILPFQSSGGVDFFKCPLCEQSYICGRESLTIHLQEHQNKTKRDDGKHLCCLCSKELSSNSSLERHLLTHSNHRPFSCSMCDKKFTTNGNLSRHIKTSHTNNEATESGIDDVLKKHQIESDKNTHLISNENKSGKYRKSSKISRKEFGSLNSGKSEVIPKDQNLIQSCLGTAEKYVSEPIFKTILPANMNFLSPLLSLNIRDFSFFPQNPTESLGFLQNKPVIPVLGKPEKITVKNFIQFDKKKKFIHLKSLSPNIQRPNKLYLKRRELCINRIRKFKIGFWISNVQCRKCGKIFLHITKIISHIRKCYSKDFKGPKYCMFKMCNARFKSRRHLLNHIKWIHIKESSENTSQQSPISEPLNLSMKSNNIFKSSDSEKEQLNNADMQYSQGSNHELKYVSSNLQSPISDSILDFSIQNSSSWSFPKSIISQIALNNKSLNIFQTTNQFISSPQTFASSPHALSTPYKTDWCNLNKIEFNDTMSNLEPISPKSDMHSQIIPSIKNGMNISIPSISLNGIENISSKISPSDFSSSLSTDDAKLKYNMGIKKKNSYKDAPKLITCPMEGCVQKFPWNSSLMRHILTHTAHKPFKCTRCTKCFSTKSNRERHMTRVHGVRINRSKFKSLQAAKANSEESSKLFEETVDSENGNLIDETVFINEKEMNITELSEEEWIIMDNNDRRAEDISNNLLKLAGQPLVEPNPVRLNNNQILLLEKSISPKSDYSSKIQHSITKDRLYMENSF